MGLFETCFDLDEMKLERDQKLPGVECRVRVSIFEVPMESLHTRTRMVLRRCLDFLEEAIEMSDEDGV